MGNSARKVRARTGKETSSKSQGDRKIFERQKASQDKNSGSSRDNPRYLRLSSSDISRMGDGYSITINGLAYGPYKFKSFRASGAHTLFMYLQSYDRVWYLIEFPKNFLDS